MTPLQLIILLHYHYSTVDYDLRKLSESMESLIADQLIEPVLKDDKKQYKISDRGRVYIEALLKVPLPVKQWVMPEQK